MMFLRLLLVSHVVIFMPALLFANPGAGHIHGPMTRQNFEQKQCENFAKIAGHPDDWAKGLLPDKDGDLGDAATTSDR